MTDPEAGDQIDVQEPADATPAGAVLITVVLLIVILGMWFGVYFLDIIRS